MRAIHLYCDLVSGSVLDGLQAELTASGVDIGARAELPAAAALDDSEVESLDEIENEMTGAEAAGIDAEATPAVE